MQQSSQIAKNYAQALIELTENDLSSQEKFLNEIKALNESFSNTKELKQIFESPAISKDEKKKIVETLRQQVSREIFNFLCILIDKQRFNVLPEIQNELNKLINKQKGIVVAEVSSVNELENETLERLRQRLEGILGSNKKITIEFKTEPSLIGGIKVKINDLVYDGSIKGRLENMKRRLG